MRDDSGMSHLMRAQLEWARVRDDSGMSRKLRFPRDVTLKPRNLRVVTRRVAETESTSSSEKSKSSKSTAIKGKTRLSWTIRLFLRCFSLNSAVLEPPPRNAPFNRVPFAAEVPNRSDTLSDCCQLEQVRNESLQPTRLERGITGTPEDGRRSNCPDHRHREGGRTL